MLHVLINLAVSPVESWRKAFPGGVELPLENLGSFEVGVGSIVWVRLSEEEGGGVLEKIREKCPDVFVVVLSDRPSEAAAASSLASGASGYCNTHAAPSVLCQVARVVEQGGVWLGQELLQRLMMGTATLLKRSGHSGQQKLDQYGLTERELEVARRVAAGASNREIAVSLQVTERTVKSHLSTIFAKLQVRDRLQLSLKVNGLLS